MTFVHNINFILNFWALGNNGVFSVENMSLIIIIALSLLVHVINLINKINKKLINKKNVHNSQVIIHCILKLWLGLGHF